MNTKKITNIKNNFTKKDMINNYSKTNHDQKFI